MIEQWVALAFCALVAAGLAYHRRRRREPLSPEEWDRLASAGAG